MPSKCKHELMTDKDHPALLLRASELRTCALALHSFYERASSKVMNSLPAIQEKYAQPKYKCVSAIHPPSRLPEAIFADPQ